MVVVVGGPECLMCRNACSCGWVVLVVNRNG